LDRVTLHFSEPCRTMFDLRSCLEDIILIDTDLEELSISGGC